MNKLDHLVLTVADIDRTVSFYQSVLGMKKVEYGGGRVALQFGDQKINLHKYKEEFSPKSHSPTPGSADLCFITDTKIDQAIAHVRKVGVEILEGPINRTGANGPILSFYFRDPDQNLIEVANEIRDP